MFIKLDIKTETSKAYCLPNGSWIPKSILDDRGLKHPFYQIKDWWLSKSVESIQNGDKSTIKVFEGIQPLVVKMNDIPKDIIEFWNKYWRSCESDFKLTEYEPRLWGNDCYEGGMSDWH